MLLDELRFLVSDWPVTDSLQEGLAKAEDGMSREFQAVNYGCWLLNLKLLRVGVFWPEIVWFFMEMIQFSYVGVGVLSAGAVVVFRFRPCR